MLVQVNPDDLEAVLNLTDVLVGKRCAGSQFVDRRDRTRLSLFYAVAVQNCEDALREQRRRPTPKAAQPAERRPDRPARRSSPSQK
jgi:hypothetical protein